MDKLNPPLPVSEQPISPEESAPKSTPELTPPVNPPRRLKIVLIGGVVFLALALVGTAIYLWQSKRFSSKEFACTLEAKQCPDGFYVSRTGPNCEFAPCPTSTADPTADWKTYTDIKYDFSFEYPSKLGTDGFFHNSDYSYESTDFYESGPGVIANSITVNIYAREFKKNDALRDVKYLIEERQDAEKMLNLKIGEAFEKNCYIYHRKSDIVINGINTAIYESSSGLKPCLRATWYAYTKKAIIQRGDILIVFAVAPYTQKQDDKLLTYFNQILSTFQFLPASPTGGGQVTPTSSGYEVCVQVITPARNPQTGECREFPTPCDVPQGWVAESCRATN